MQVPSLVSFQTEQANCVDDSWEGGILGYRSSMACMAANAYHQVATKGRFENVGENSREGEGGR